MRFQTALVAATSLASTSAFLITPEIAEAVNQAKNSFKSLILDSSQSVDVKCHECPLFVPIADEDKDSHAEETYTVSKDIFESTIHLDFSTKSGALQVNNETIFPLSAIKPRLPNLTAHQTLTGTGEDLATVPIDFVLTSQTLEKPRRHPNVFGHVQEDQHELVTVDFTVIGLAGEPIKAQTAHADLIFHDGVYTLARLRAAEFNPTAPGEDDLKVCQNARNVQLCRVRLIANRKLREMIQGALARAQFIKEWMRTHGPGNKARPCTGGPGHRIGTMKDGHRFQHGQHGQYGHHHRHHRYMRYASYLVTAMVTICVSVAVGFGCAFVFIFFVNLIIGMWMWLQGSRRESEQNQSEVALEEGEKEGLMVGEEPPAYEYRDDVPLYTEAGLKTETRE